MTGTEVQAAIIELADRLGYMHHHETDSRKTNPGFPDLVIAGHGLILFIECKGQREKLRPARVVQRRRGPVQLPGQDDWLQALASCGANAIVCRPQAADIAGRDTAGDWYELGLDDVLQWMADKHAGRQD